MYCAMTDAFERLLADRGAKGVLREPNDVKAIAWTQELTVVNCFAEGSLEEAGWMWELDGCGCALYVGVVCHHMVEVRTVGNKCVH